MVFLDVVSTNVGIWSLETAGVLKQRLKSRNVSGARAGVSKQCGTYVGVLNGFDI